MRQASGSATDTYSLVKTKPAEGGETKREMLVRVCVRLCVVCMCVGLCVCLLCMYVFCVFACMFVYQANRLAVSCVFWIC